MTNARWAGRVALAVTLALPAAAGLAPPAHAGTAPTESTMDSPVSARSGLESTAAANEKRPVPAGFPSWEALLATQERLLAAAETVIAAARTTAGLGGVQLRLELNEVWVHWKGTPPAGVAAAVEAARATAAVRVFPARYTEQELLAAAKAIRDPAVVSVGPLPDGSGLSVAVTGSARALPDAGVPVTVRPFARPAPVTASRQNDSPPYFGGAFWKHTTPQGTGYCTNGFAVLQNGVKKMLTAGHCGTDGETAKDGGGQVMGLLEGDNNPKDLLLIGTASAGWTYVGAYTSSVAKKVIGGASSVAGMFVCTSGANSGDHCGLKITGVNLTRWVNTGTEIYQVHPLVEAKQQIEEEIAVAEGDSGGPVILQTITPELHRAAGTITAMDDEVEDCGPLALAGARCGRTVLYVDLATALAHYNATIIQAVPVRKAP